MTPSWLITTIWFIAGIGATGGFWYFLGSNNRTGIIISASITIVSVTTAVFCHIRNDKLTRKGIGSIPERLLSFVWSYPLTGKNEESWAMKESAALRGDLGVARDKPSLGVAIVTTELATCAFGEAANSRIDLCVAWAIGHTEDRPPYQIQVVSRGESHDEKLPIKMDFRHTLAFGVILARTGRQPDYLISYLGLVIERQRRDGGWPSDSAVPMSPVFTAFYALELLYLSSSNSNIPEKIRNDIPRVLFKGIKWLMKHQSEEGLWSSSVLKDFTWDYAFTTAWILHRLTSTAEVGVVGWQDSLDKAAFGMIQNAIDPQTWKGSTEAERYRVEARIAAAATRFMRKNIFSSRSNDLVHLYLKSWNERVQNWLNQTDFDKIDVGTAAFLAYAMVSDDQLKIIGKKIVETSI